MNLFRLERRPLKAGDYPSQATAADGTRIPFTLRVQIIDGRADYEIHLPDGTVADALSRRYHYSHGVTGWWSIVGPELYWGTRADAAFHGWINAFTDRLARRAVLTDSDWNLGPRRDRPGPVATP